jgi:hypothetical protein
MSTAAERVWLDATAAWRRTSSALPRRLSESRPPQPTVIADSCRTTPRRHDVNELRSTRELNYDTIPQSPRHKSHTPIAGKYVTLALVVPFSRRSPNTQRHAPATVACSNPRLSQFGVQLPWQVNVIWLKRGPPLSSRIS